MPRRISDYPDAFAGWNFTSSFGSIISVAATWLFLYILYVQLVEAKASQRYPWLVSHFYGDIFQTLFSRKYISIEWGLNSPPKPHAFTSLPLQSRPVIFTKNKTKRLIWLVLSVILSALIRYAIKEWFNLDLAILTEFLFVYVPAGVIPGLLFMEAGGPSDTGTGSAYGTGSASGTGTGTNTNTDNNAGSDKEKELAAAGNRLDGLGREFVEVMNNDKLLDELDQQRIDKENQLLGIRNITDKDPSQKYKFADQEAQGLKELEQIDSEINKLRRRNTEIMQLAHKAMFGIE